MQAFLVLIPYRWYMYINEKRHYIFIEWTYMTNTLTLLYLWLPISDEIRAQLFPTVYALMTGPLVMSTMALQQELKLQCEDKMTSIFVHVYPSLAVWGLKWYNSCRLEPKQVSIIFQCMYIPSVLTYLCPCQSL